MTTQRFVASNINPGPFIVFTVLPLIQSPIDPWRSFINSYGANVLSDPFALKLPVGAVDKVINVCRMTSMV